MLTWDEVAMFGGQLIPFLTLAATIIGGGKWFIGQINKSLDEKLEKVDAKMDDKLRPIIYEMQPNGGGSIKDAVRNLGVGQGKISAKLDSISTMSELAHARINIFLSNSETAWYEMDYRLVNGEPITSVISVNEAYFHLFGLTEQEALHTLKWRDQVHPEDLLRVDAAGAMSLHTQGDFQINFSVLHNGLLVPVRARAKGLYVNNEFTGWAGAMAIDWHRTRPLDDAEHWPPPPKQMWFR